MWYNFFGGFMLIDTHCHLGYEDYRAHAPYSKDREAPEQYEL